MAVIFIMSSFNSAESSSQSNTIVNFITSTFNISNTNLLILIVRKLAHITEYFILGILVYNMLKFYNKRIWIAIIICLLYAISDEFHQMFVPGRSAQVLDVFIDTLGSSLGVFLLNMVKKYKFYVKNML
jgi:VanZ family protein